MARKKSIKLTAAQFNSHCDEIQSFLQAARSSLSDEQISWCYEYAIIRLYREFEHLVLETLTGAINNDTATISETTGYAFPKHLTDEICEYLVIGTGYFDFKGRDGLVKIIKKYIPDSHYLLKIIKNNVYKTTIEKLSALRNLATHKSVPAQKAALSAIGQDRIGSSGSWLKRQDRFTEIVATLKLLANEIQAMAPY